MTTETATTKTIKDFTMGSKMTIGNLIRSMVMTGHNTEQILSAIVLAFPAAKTSPSCVSWYRSQLRHEGFSC